MKLKAITVRYLCKEEVELMSIELTRVDFRLIHGQVITRWLTQCQINEIVTIDNDLNKDPFMQEVFKMAAPKGVKITMDEDTVRVALAINIRYGYSVPSTCTQIQEKVKTAIETMTGLDVAEVNVKIVNVTMDNENTK